MEVLIFEDNSSKGLEKQLANFINYNNIRIISCSYSKVDSYNTKHSCLLIYEG